MKWDKKDRAIDAVPININKEIGILKIIDMLHMVDCKKIYAFGDGKNDIPMFEFATHVILIGDLEYQNNTKKIINLDSIADLEEYLKKFSS